MHWGLHELSNAQRSSFHAIYMNVPEPLEARDAAASSYFPWRSFHNRCVRAGSGMGTCC